MSDVITLPKPFSRTSARPIDRESVFSTYADLLTYAASPIAYRGQILSVSGTNVAYIINNDLTVQPIALESFSNTKFLPLSGGFVTGNIISNSTLSANEIDVDNIQLEGNTISITNTNGDLTLSPNGTGEVNISKVDIDAGTIDGVSIGSASAATYLKVDNIQIDANDITSTNTNGDINITPNGTGEVNITKVDIDSGTIDNVTIGGTSAAVSVSAFLLNVDNIQVDGNNIVSTNSNGDISLTPNGTGEVNITKVDIDSGTIDAVSIGSTSAATYLKVDNIEIDGNNIVSTNSNGDISLTPNGTGEVNITKVDIDSGTIDGVTIGGASAAISVSAALLNVDNIRVDQNTISSTNTNGNIIISPNGTGSLIPGADNTVDLGTPSIEWKDLYIDGTANIDSLVADTADINGGTIDGVTIGSSSVATSISAALLNVDNLQLDGNSITSTNTNGDINLTPNGTGTVNLPKVNIDNGTIDGTTIGLTVPASGVFTGISVGGNVNISGNLYVAGSSTQINTVDLTVKDPIIFLAEGNFGDAVDIGFTAAYEHDLATKRHTGLVRDNTNKKWTLFSNLSAEILSATQVPFNNPSVVIDTLIANVEGTITGNVSGTAAQAVKFVTGRTISTTGDIIYTSEALDGTANVTGTATISSNVVSYSKIQKAGANTIIGNPTGSTANVQEITCTAAGRALLDDASASDQRNTLGVGAAQTVTFGEVIVNNGSKSVLSDVYNGTVTSGNTLTLTTFPSANYFSAKYTVQIKDTNSNERCALEIIATNNNGTWEGTVYGIVDPGTVFTNVDVGLTTTVNLEFTFNGVSNYNVVVYTQAISD